MAKTVYEWIDEAKSGSLGIASSAIAFLAFCCSKLERENEELQTALNQSRADRDENEQVIIRLQEKNRELQDQLRITTKERDIFVNMPIFSESKGGAE